MKVLIAGGRGFLGSAVADAMRKAGHDTQILTRSPARQSDEIHWDGVSGSGWSHVLTSIDAVVNATGYGLEHWPWTFQRRKQFLDSRVVPGQALASAIIQSNPRPKVFIQISGINYYGSHGETEADESTPAGNDFLAELTIKWEAATKGLEQGGVRWIIARTAVVLDAKRGLFPLMILPVRLFAGGRLGDGQQSVSWIHITDQVQALRYLMEKQDAQGVYNLVAPTYITNEQFMRAAARHLGRPYWLHIPEQVLRISLGAMSVLLLEGRKCRPKRLLEQDYRFTFPTFEEALQNLSH